MDFADSAPSDEDRCKAQAIMVERPALRLVEDDDLPPCALCGEHATHRSATDSAPLCLSCFTETHWHPSWNRSFEGPPGD